MDFISVKEAAERWGISERRVRALCESGRIEGVTRCGDWVWSIPANTQRPADGRTLRFIKNRSLRTGSQDYRKADRIRSSSRSGKITDSQKAQIIAEALAFASIDVTTEQIKDVFALKHAGLDLETEIKILNLKGALSGLPVEISEKTLCEINKRILTNISKDNGGTYAVSANQAQETEAMLGQYAGPWSVLHPVARTAFLFAELLRIKPFAKASEETAFVVLASELIKSKLPPAIFGVENIGQLKAALASTQMRGNTQALIELILESVS